jgi:two-component system, NarL family, invasion response regulator UvrY
MIRVVLCDDARTFPVLASRWLEAEGDVAVVATPQSAAELRAFLAEEDADVVVLDLVLPDVDDPGPVVRELRAVRPGAAIVLCSSLAADRLAATAAELGADGWVHKANDPAAFRAAVRAAAAGR